MVLIPFSHGISVSRRIRNPRERKRLVEVLKDLVPENFAIIVRTAAENRQVHYLKNDLEYLMKRWELIVQNLKKGNKKLLGEYDIATSLIRDLLNDPFEAIIVDDEATFHELEKYIESVPGLSRDILVLHKEKKPPFEYFHIDRQIKSSFGKIVNFNKGAYLVIEKTEAMYVIDVNSGSKTNGVQNREEAIFKINMDAAEEIARQLRLRDIGGLIVVDFIDMKSPEKQKALYEKMKEVMKNDRTQHSCTPISKFGLMEITRQRVKPAIEINQSETCPVCRGSGELKPTILVTHDIEHSLNYIRNELKIRYVQIKVHPFIAAYLKSGFPSLRLKWMLRYRMYCKIIPSEAMQLVDYKLLDKNGKDLEEFE